MLLCLNHAVADRVWENHLSCGNLGLMPKTKYQKDYRDTINAALRCEIRDTYTCIGHSKSDNEKFTFYKMLQDLKTICALSLT